MADSRLSLALASGAAVLPADGTICVVNPGAGSDLTALPAERVRIVQRRKPDHDAWAARGYRVAAVPEGDCALAVLYLPRAKDEARDLLADAVTRTRGGPVIVDGQKTDGIDSLLKACRARGHVGAPLAKAHGKLFVFGAAPDAMADWRVAEPAPIEGGFVTLPGVFSADGVDRASCLLADALPGLKGRVADLGAGWGYLAARALAASPDIAEMHLIEADHAALDCARINVADPRARFHWADATRFAPENAFDAVICNPPFHAGRSADPELGRAFLRAAAAMLAPQGALYVVANRHLPYERELGALFREVAETGGDAGFKVIRASRPQGRPRPSR
ncbi:16S rRNA (guanine1207-N2)-methyltransferase [Rhodovulum iodosum]|uniref:16S rRNA (Guanine1207-N2)-methyltransferase n=1 Tax=Rhodovulum iodosum TaxID=68291 RepID=A0ABV3XQW3_9RHOB|nr:class I SAM-dependent methyltransferase [Rhodovulum robiginosum]RSK32861.1 class I SAM-dependent methyltransferase [Rhodovulum robiginosum]